MKSWPSRLLVMLAVAGVAGCATWTRWTHKAESAGEPAPPAEAAQAHVMLVPGALKWQPFPPGGAGAKLAVLSGDPEKSGPFVIRIRQPAGSKIPPHWHPKDEHVTVIKGTMFFGTGEKLQKGEAVVQVHGKGPFQVIYVNPADDPRNKPTKR